MSNKIQGIIALALGGSGFVRWLNAPASASDYSAGSNAGMLVMSIVFLLAGLYFYRKD